MLRSLSGLANLGNMMKQAQEMSAKMQGVAEKLKTMRTTGQSGGGMVEVDANGLGEVLAVRIDPQLFAGGDREMIEDLLPAAFNAAHAKAKELHQQAMQEITSDLNLPGLEEAMSKLVEPPSSPS
jgi:DNA-binding YbaB/EbfC family protein